VINNYALETRTLYLAKRLNKIMSLRKKYQLAAAEWNKQNNFTLFGSCLFNYESTLSKSDRVKAMKRFWNAIDRKIYTKKEVVVEGKRVERLVYVEEGRGRDFIHFHFFCKAETPKQLKQIINASQHFWNKNVNDTQILDLKLNQRSDDRSGYGVKEFSSISNEQILTECCHLKQTHP